MMGAVTRVAGLPVGADLEALPRSPRLALAAEFLALQLQVQLQCVYGGSGA